MTRLGKRAGVGVPVTILVILILTVAGGITFWFLDKQARQTEAEGPVLTAEAKAYVRRLQLSDVQMKAAETFLGQQLVEIHGKITNAGDRPLRLVEINCVFYDPWGQIVLRERVAIVRRLEGTLGPGETRDFRLPFDALPESWNQGMPQLVIAQILFDD